MALSVLQCLSAPVIDGAAWLENSIPCSRYVLVLLLLLNSASLFCQKLAEAYAGLTIAALVGGEDMRRRLLGSRALRGEWVQLDRVEQCVLVYYCRTLVRELDLGGWSSIAVDRWGLQSDA